MSVNYQMRVIEGQISLVDLVNRAYIHELNPSVWTLSGISYMPIIGDDERWLMRLISITVRSLAASALLGGARLVQRLLADSFCQASQHQFLFLNITRKRCKSGINALSAVLIAAAADIHVHAGHGEGRAASDHDEDERAQDEVLLDCDDPILCLHIDNNLRSLLLCGLLRPSAGVLRGNQPPSPCNDFAALSFRPPRTLFQNSPPSGISDRCRPLANRVQTVGCLRRVRVERRSRRGGASPLESDSLCIVSNNRG